MLSRMLYTRLIGPVTLALAVLTLTGCAPGVVVPATGPLYGDVNGNIHLGIAVAGKEAGAPCLDSPVCWVPAQ